jgi:hypothetical protein
MEEYSNRRFITFNTSETGSINYNEVEETSSETLRLSVDKSLTFVKYILPQPTSVANLTTKSQEYTYDEFLDILATSTWTPTGSNIPM